MQARIADYNPDNPKLPVNSPNAHYAITEEALQAIKTFGTKAWKEGAERFKSEVGALSKRYLKERKQNLIPVKLSNGKTLKLLTSSLFPKYEPQNATSIVNTGFLILIWVSRSGLFRFAACIGARKRISPVS